MKVTPLALFTLNLGEALHLRGVLEKDPRGTDGHEALEFVRGALDQGIGAIVDTVGPGFLLLEDEDVQVEITLPESGVRALAGFIGARTPGLDRAQNIDIGGNRVLNGVLTDTLLDLRAFGSSADLDELLEISEEFDVDAVELAQARGRNAARELAERREERAELILEFIAQGRLVSADEEE